MNTLHESISQLHKIFRFIWQSNIKTKRRLVFTLLVTFTTIGLNTTFPILFKHIVNSLLGGTPVHLVAYAIGGYVLIWLVHQIIIQLKTYLTLTVIESYSCIIRKRLFSHLLSLPLSFHVKRKTGENVQVFTHLQRGLESIFWGLVLYLIPTLLELCITTGILTYLYGRLLGLIFLLTTVIYLIFNTIAMEKIQRAQKKYNLKSSSITSRMTDVLFNIETIFFFNNKQYEQAQLSRLLESQKEAAHLRDFSDYLLQIIQLSMIGISLLATLLLVVYNPALNVSDFILINTYILQVTAPLQHIGYIIRQIGKGIQDMSQALALFEEKSEVSYALPTALLKNTKNTITFDKVSFGYDPAHPILRDISFTIPHGKTVALVGSTGAGKSTIAKLLFRFFDIQQGQILLNDQDIHDLSPESVRSLIGIVPQEATLFNDTLLNNIQYGNLDASQDAIDEALSLAGLDVFIKELPDGLDTLVGERGLRLSGGEKQRLAIARMLIKQPLLNIFDEASSALDLHTEQTIQNNIRKISQQKTTLIIAHRLTSIAHADIILVLDKGRIVEEGTHKHLMHFDGRYSKLWSAQQIRRV